MGEGHEQRSLRLSLYKVRQGGPDPALRVWVAEPQEALRGTIVWFILLFLPSPRRSTQRLGHPAIDGSLWVTSRAAGTPVGLKADQPVLPRWSAYGQKNRFHGAALLQIIPSASNSS